MSATAGNNVNSRGKTVPEILGLAFGAIYTLVGIALSRTLAGARTYGWLLAVGYGAAFVYGLIAVGEDWDFLNLNAADNVLHIATAIVGLVIALGPVRNAVDHRGTRV